jgi:hypothetical protein
MPGTRFRIYMSLPDAERAFAAEAPSEAYPYGTNPLPDLTQAQVITAAASSGGSMRRFMMLHPTVWSRGPAASVANAVHP